jgi:RNA polymerase sigma-70 factor (ECF subfamily)
MAEHISTTQNPDDDPDVALIHAVAAGDVHALDELYARFGPGLLSYLTSYLNDRQLAEEVLQDVMLAVWNNASGFRGESKVRTWLIVIARNRAINTRRRKEPQLMPLDDELDFQSSDTGPLEKIERKDQQEALREVLQTLPPTQREILELVFFHQLSGPEVADVLGINIGTVKSRLHRAKEMLRRVLQVTGETSNA